MNKIKFIPTNKVGVFYYESTERKDRCFYITYKIGGSKKREKIGWKSEGYTTQIASDIRAERMQQLRHGIEVVRKLTFKEGVDKYLDSIKDKPSYSLNVQYLSVASAYFGYSTNLASITSMHIVEYISYLKSKVSERTGKLLSDQTVVHHYKAVRQVYNYLIGLGLFSGQSPLNKRTMSALPKVNNEIVNYLTDDEMERFMHALNNYHDKLLANFFLFATYTGIRQGEIFELKLSDIDFKKNLIYISADSAKSKQNEVVEISDHAIEIIQAQQKLKKSLGIISEYIFCNKHGNKREDVKVQFATLKRKAEITRPFRFHDLRHNFATMVLAVGGSLYEVQKLLNHKDPKTTQRYAHLVSGKLTEITNKAFEK